MSASSRLTRSTAAAVSPGLAESSAETRLFCAVMARLQRYARPPASSSMRTPERKGLTPMSRISPISPAERTCVPQQAQRSAPGHSTMRTAPLRAFLLRYSSVSSSSGVGYVTRKGRFSQITRLACSSISSSAASVTGASKSMTTVSAPIWKPTLLQCAAAQISPLTMCSPECCCIRSKRASQSISPTTAAPTGRGPSQKCVTAPSAIRVSVTRTPPSVPPSPGCPPPSG